MLDLFHAKEGPNIQKVFLVQRFGRERVREEDQGLEKRQ